MKTLSAMVALAAKDLRELLPLWAASVVGLVLVALSGVFTPAGLFALPGAILAALVPVALGAMVIGHEYRHGTMASLLSLPIGRGPILGIKALVLVGLLGAAGAIAWWIGARTPWLWLPLACGLCLAPWFTLISRNEVAGMVFGGAVPALLLLAGEFVAEYTHGSAIQLREAAGLLRDRVLASGTAVACALAAVDTVRRFLSLQQIDNMVRAATLRRTPASRTASVRRVHSVYGALLIKELHLQAMPLFMACALGVSWAGLSLLPDDVDVYRAVARISFALQPLLAILLAILCGAVASAEERYAGTWASQALLPVAMWKQWTVKVVVVLGLALAFGIALGPAEAATWRFGYRTVAVSLPGLAVAAAALSLYVSSVSSRAVIALLVSAGAASVWMLFAFILVTTFRLRLFHAAWQAFYEAIPSAMLSNEGAVILREVVGWLLLTLSLAVPVWLAMTNHRRLDNPARTLRWQVAVIVLVSLVSLAGTTVSAAFEDAVNARNKGGGATWPRYWRYGF